MQAIDVLRHERVQFSPALERNERLMAEVGLRAPGGVCKAALPGEFADFRVGNVVAYIRQALCLGIARPHALWATKVGNTGIGRDTGAGEDDDALCVIDQLTRSVEWRHESSSIIDSKRRSAS